MLAGIALAALTLSAAPEDVGVVFRSSGSGAAALLAACPRVAVFEESGGGEQLRGFLASCSGTEAVVQLPPVPGGTPFVASAEDARLRAASYWTFVTPGALAPLAVASQAERALVWLAGPPGFDSVPSWRDDPACDAGALFCAADYVGTFWAELHLLARDAGYRGLLLPPYSPQQQERPAALCRLLAGVDAASGVALGMGWTYDAVSPGLAQSAVTEGTTTFGYRALRDGCPSARVHPLLVRVSAAGGWQARASATGFIEWLRWLDGEVDADADPFLGLALFGYGTGGGSDLSPYAPQLAAYLVDPLAPPGGGGPGGVGPPSSPPTEPGSNLGPDRGSNAGCSTAGGGSLGLAVLAVLAAGRRRVGARTRRLA